MELVIVALVLILLIISVSVGVYFLLEHRRLKRFEDQVDYEIDKRRERISGANRFLFNEDVLAVMFPEYSMQDRRIIWKRLVARNRVEMDPMDNAMCIKK